MVARNAHDVLPSSHDKGFIPHFEPLLDAGSNIDLIDFPNFPGATTATTTRASSTMRARRTRDPSFRISSDSRQVPELENSSPPWACMRSGESWRPRCIRIAENRLIAESADNTDFRYC